VIKLMSVGRARIADGAFAALGAASWRTRVKRFVARSGAYRDGATPIADL
jgi:hypothetical protein